MTSAAMGRGVVPFVLMVGLAVTGCVRNLDLTVARDATPESSPSASCAQKRERCTEAATCCSGICKLRDRGDGTCDDLSDCQAAYDRCTTGSDCCSGVCLLAKEDSGRCQPASGCSSIGERCTSSSLCCSGACSESSEGVLRCAATECKALGETCEKSDECCDKDPTSCRSGTGAGLRCLGAPGALAVCQASGSPCAVPEQCCSLTCVAGAALACGAGVAADPSTSTSGP